MCEETPISDEEYNELMIIRSTIPQAMDELRRRANDTISEEFDPFLIISDLAKLFSKVSLGNLDKAPGLVPWEPKKLVQWATSHTEAEPEDIASVRFLHSLWFQSRATKMDERGRFDLLDMQHLGQCSEIVAEWFKNPFWFDVGEDYCPYVPTPPQANPKP